MSCGLSGGRKEGGSSVSAESKAEMFLSAAVGLQGVSDGVTVWRGVETPT